jgi:hypothetical protein
MAVKELKILWSLIRSRLADSRWASFKTIAELDILSPSRPFLSRT